MKTTQRIITMDGKRILDIIVAARALSDEQLVTLIENMMRGVPRSFKEAAEFVEAAKRDTEHYKTNDHGSDISRKFESDTDLPSFIQIGYLGITFTYKWGTNSKVTVRYPPDNDATFVSGDAISGKMSEGHVTFIYAFNREIPASLGSAWVTLADGKIAKW